VFTLVNIRENVGLDIVENVVTPYSTVD